MVAASTPQVLRVFEGPPIEDNFYFNNLDWSCHNVLAVGSRSLLMAWRADLSEQDPQDDEFDLPPAAAAVAAAVAGATAVDTTSGATSRAGTRARLDHHGQHHHQGHHPGAAAGAASQPRHSGNQLGVGGGNRWRRRVRSSLVAADVTAVRWDPTGERLTVGMKDGKVLLWQVETGQAVSAQPEWVPSGEPRY